TRMPPANAIRPDRRAAGVLRAPTAHPTRTDPAWPTPTAAQNVKLASEIATWCAAMARAPRRPARRPTRAKTPTSAPICSPTCIPTLSALRKSCTLGPRGSRGRTASAGTPRVAGAKCLRKQGIQAHHAAEADHRDGEEEAVGEADRAERGRPQPADDGGVDQAHQRVAGLGKGDRRRETQQLAKLVHGANSVRGRRAGRWFRGGGPPT